MAAKNSAWQQVVQVLRSAKNRIFCTRNVIIISEHKTQHVPITGKVQLLLVAGVLGFVTWASYSTGSYMAAQKVLAAKDQKIATTAQENERIEAEFSLLRRDLLKLASDGQDGKISEDAKQLVNHYANEQAQAAADAAEEIKQLKGNAKASDYNLVLERIAYLENKVKTLQESHNSVMRDLKVATGGKIKELERVIAMTGVDRTALEKKAQAKRVQMQQHREKYGRIQNEGQGGPFEPIRMTSLKQQDPALYFDVKRMMDLHDVVSTMPLATPMKGSFRYSSGFGTRVDPFNGRLAFHSGLDLAAPPGARALASAPGKVVFTGWKNAYGYTVDVDHGLGFSTRYAHLKAITVRTGQLVKKYDAVGIQGSTGRSTGNHLHYEVRYNDRPLNPANFIKAGNYVYSID
jgi:murein DD-endopeptidase MepM/ murein hydrolase activator NlpD